MMDGLTPGFADPVRDAQSCFRALLDAMARPGLVRAVNGPPPPAPLPVAAGAVLLSLIDHETPLWLDPALRQAAPWIAFHCGAPLVTHQRDARFLVAMALPPLAEVSLGGHETPEDSATVILPVRALSTGRCYRLSGPGLRHPTPLLADGLPDDFTAWWRANHAAYPLGVDLILCADDRLCALPRGVTIEDA